MTFILILRSKVHTLWFNRRKVRISKTVANKFPNTKKNNSEHNVTNQFYPMLKANNTTQISETKAKEINKIKKFKGFFVLHRMPQMYTISTVMAVDDSDIFHLRVKTPLILCNRIVYKQFLLDVVLSEVIFFLLLFQDMKLLRILIKFVKDKYG